MTIDLKKYLYRSGKDAALDAEFRNAAPYDKVKLGNTAIFWKGTLRWYALPLDKVQRIYRRAQGVNTKVGCGCVSYNVHKLMLVLDEETTLELTVSEGQPEPADRLFAALKEAHPELQFGTE